MITGVGSVMKNSPGWWVGSPINLKLNRFCKKASHAVIYITNIFCFDLERCSQRYSYSGVTVRESKGNHHRCNHNRKKYRRICHDHESSSQHCCHSLATVERLRTDFYIQSTVVFDHIWNYVFDSWLNFQNLNSRF